ncbi:acyl-CoA dehydrogenase family protein [uncultured Sulfitobacter sp.]|uniref:acyl-CoA dehydrogenase family protein n=1 Tax=uncultured Sulfitobacter sp. TaxID=191468 RepID=UPI0026155FEC|nr:acyl-CoA dehydrogenase family protein [uncultured Sulfitobacter sp.]
MIRKRYRTVATPCAVPPESLHGVRRVPAGIVAHRTTHRKTGEALGGPFTQFRNIRSELAERKITVARAVPGQRIAVLPQGVQTIERAAMAKYWTTDAQGERLAPCLRLQERYGFMQDYVIGQMSADARVQRTYGGTNEMTTKLIARSP